MATSPLRPQVLGAYRKLLLASRLAFGKNTEKDRITADHIRQAFMANSAETDPKKIKKMLRAAGMAEDIFRKQVYELTETDTEGTYRLHYRQDQLIDLRKPKPDTRSST
ncbi:uncharacterized protein LOC135822795 [Sycon ciliatum]|uniref:uncharacterized protein LOC135822795 n=1 Tax=Sycon ciliatum TaxID=27933 RepID=UPI0020ADD5CB|eukprot:scpid88190/ scgid25342/ 